MRPDDPRDVQTYGKYVGKDTVGAWVAYLSIYAGLFVADRGQMTDNGYRLKNTILAKLRGSFEHEAMGWVPVFDFEVDVQTPEGQWLLDNYNTKQGEFLKALMCGEYDSHPPPDAVSLP